MTPDLEASADLLKALAHPLRLAILQALTGGERSVGAIEERAGIGQPALSQQLGILRNAGLVETRRDAKLVFYRINLARIAEIGALLGRLVGPAPAPEPAGRPPRGGAAMFARIG